MCYFNSLQIPEAEKIRLLHLEKELKGFNKDIPLQSGFDFSEWPIIKPLAGKKDFEIINAHWEFIAPWCKTMNEVIESRKKFTTLNAVGEKILESRLYRDAALKRRCLVLSSGFFEWRHYKPEHLNKDSAYPYFITMAGRKEYFFMAGIYQPWTDRETGETIDTFAVLTTAANPLMQQIHNTKKRMPVLLPEKLAYEWIFDTLNEKRIQELASYQVHFEEMIAWSIRKDFKVLTNPADEFLYAELPPLNA